MPISRFGLLPIALAVLVSVSQAQPVLEGRPPVPALNRLLIRVPVGVEVEAAGAHVLTGLVEIDATGDFVEQLPSHARAMVLEFGAYRPIAELDSMRGLRVPREVEVGASATAWIPREAGNCLGSGHATPDALRAIAASRGPEVPIRYTFPHHISRLAYGPATLVRRTADGYFAAVPDRVVIDERGEFRVTLKEVGPFAGAPGPGDLPESAPVFSRFSDGKERRGAFRRNYAAVAVHHLDDRRAGKFVFAPGLGYQFLREGPSRYCGTGLQGVPPPYPPGMCEPAPMPESESVPIRYDPGAIVLQSLTPTIQWRPFQHATSHHIFIRAGTLVYDDLDVFEQRRVAGTSVRLPEGVLRPGTTYHLMVTGENSVGHASREVIIATAPDACADPEYVFDVP